MMAYESVMSLSPDFEKWITEKNEELREAGVSPRQREFRLIEMWFEQKQHLEDGFWFFATPEAKAIRNWLTANTKYGDEMQQPINSAAFFFDQSFWELVIPVIYGAVYFDPSTSLRGMPQRLLKDLLGDLDDRHALFEHFRNGVRYLNNLISLEKSPQLTPLARQLLAAAESHLDLATSNLLSSKPDASSLQTMRMSVEMFLKAVLAQAGWDQAKLKKLIGHKLEEALKEVAKLPDFQGLAGSLPLINSLPGVGCRYDDPRTPLADLWIPYRDAYKVIAELLEILAR